MRRIRRRRRPGRHRRRFPWFDSTQARKDRARFVRRGSTFDGAFEQAPGSRDVAAIERRHTAFEELLRLALPLGQRGTGPFDVRTRARMMPVEEQRARPDVDRLIVAPGEVLIEPVEQQLLDLGIPIRLRRGMNGGGVIAPKRIRHGLGEETSELYIRRNAPAPAPGHPTMLACSSRACPTSARVAGST